MHARLGSVLVESREHNLGDVEYALDTLCSIKQNQGKSSYLGLCGRICSDFWAFQQPRHLALSYGVAW